MAAASERGCQARGWSRVLEAPTMDHVEALYSLDLGNMEEFQESWGGRHSNVAIYQLVWKYFNILMTRMAL